MRSNVCYPQKQLGKTDHMTPNTWEVAASHEELVQDLMTAGGVTRPTALVLAARGITTDKVECFLRPTLRSLTDPFDLPGTAAAAERLWQAINRGERIIVHGDYDTDGITASVLLASVLRQNGAEVTCYLPHRIDDGYGLTPDAIEMVCREGYGLLVTVDCGITSFDAINLARERGIGVIVTDHHVPGSEPPDAAAVVNPKLPGAPPETLDLAGVGVAFKACHAFLKYGRENGFGGQETDLRNGLDLVALGTVADIVPLLDENRLLVKFGLDVLSKQQRPGIHALCEAAGASLPIRSTDITYRLAPRLNAAGRMGDPTESLKLLEASSMVEAAALARALDKHNRARQESEEKAVNAAEEQIAGRYNMDETRSVVVWSDVWHQGVVGIVASRLARRYHRPCVVLTRDTNGQLTGSARSVRRLDLVRLMEKCRSSLIRFGGHAMAAGLSLEAENLEAFCESFEESVAQVLGVEAMKPQIDICGILGLEELTDVFFSELEMLEPFGHGNPEPVFVTHGVVAERAVLAGKSHTRGTVSDASGQRISFIAFGRLPEEFPESPWSLVYSPQLNHYAGRTTPQLRIIDVRASNA